MIKLSSHQWKQFFNRSWKQKYYALGYKYKNLQYYIKDKNYLSLGKHKQVCYQNGEQHYMQHGVFDYVGVGFFDKN